MTTKPSAPVVGFNHNVKYGEHVYHVQTEDSGLPHAHYITHLFVGGNIVASTKTSYADKADDPELPKLVRSLMEAQHKQMLKRLVAGEFKEQAARIPVHYEPGVLADGTKASSYTNVASEPPAPAMVSPRPEAAPAIRAEAPQAARAEAPAAARGDARREPSIGREPQPRTPPVMSPVAPAAQPPPHAQRAAPPPFVDRRAPRPDEAPPVSRTPPPRTPGAPLPSVTRASPQHVTRPVSPPRMEPVAPPVMMPAQRAAPAQPPRASQPPPALPEAPVEMPHENLPTLFAEELISEKSLDEVILAFLSLDIEPPK